MRLKKELRLNNINRLGAIFANRQTMIKSAVARINIYISYTSPVSILNQICYTESGDTNMDNFLKSQKYLTREAKKTTPVQAAKNKELKLEELLSKITTKNLHKEINMGNAVGNEIW